MFTNYSSDWSNAGEARVVVVPFAQKTGVTQVPVVVDFSQSFRWMAKKQFPAAFKGVFRYESAKSGSPMTAHEVAFQTGIL
jgi:hypothetical protein